MRTYSSLVLATAALLYGVCCLLERTDGFSAALRPRTSRSATTDFVNNIVSRSRSHNSPRSHEYLSRFSYRSSLLVLLFSTSQQSSQQQRQQYSSSSSSSSVDFVTRNFNTECDDANVPPALNILLRSIDQLTYSGSDIRGKFVDHARLGNIAGVAHEIGRASPPGSPPSLTPFAAHCFGHALASMARDRQLTQSYGSKTTASPTTTPTTVTLTSSMADSTAFTPPSVASARPTTTTICIGVDPRKHSMRLADALARGAESVPNTQVLYCGLATTPACAAFVHLSTKQQSKADASVMVTASHLPSDRNGFKIFFEQGGLSRDELLELGRRAKDVATSLFRTMMVPPTSGNEAVMCSGWVDWMPLYANALKQAIRNEAPDHGKYPLQGLKIVLNAGNGSGGFFAPVLSELGADVSGSIHLTPDPDFPNGIPNPEYQPMITETIRACEECQADLGIMLDTDADRCGFVVPTGNTNAPQYEPLNRNRLIALMGVIFATQSPGCAIVTDSVTSEGLTTFLNQLGLTHVRYLKGYANVINKAKELTTNRVVDAQVAIETSGHCAMQENRYLDDGTYTAAKVVSLLARRSKPLLRDWIANYKDLDEVSEIRLSTLDQSLLTMQSVFDFCALEIEQLAEYHGDPTTSNWQVDVDNLEGIRVRVGDGQFFMLRKSLHDPLVSLHIEAHSKHTARQLIVQPILRLLESEESVSKALDLSALDNY